MTDSYFLGANSHKGFYSLYGGFPAEKDTLLHIIKGGPGTGKSTLMRKIGAKAQKRGLDVEYVRCSGDPGSLDGVYIPKIKQAWVDGTAPHVVEPSCYGVSGDYINLGAFCRGDFSDEEKTRLRELMSSHKREYKVAYGFLALAAHAVEVTKTPDITADTEKKIRERIRSACNKNIPAGDGREGSVIYRFYSAISYEGHISLKPDFYEKFRQIIKVDSAVGGEQSALRFAAEEIARRGETAVVGLSPLIPERIELVAAPRCGVLFLSSKPECREGRSIRVDTLLPDTMTKEKRHEIRCGEKVRDEMTALALERLKRAKQLHDQIERIYLPHMDFDALNAYTEGLIREI